MRRLITYLRSCFCKHELELLCHEVADKPMYLYNTKAHSWTFMCKKCGYIKTYNNKHI